MIFAKTYMFVLNGLKTQTRRPVKEGDSLETSETGEFTYIFNKTQKRARYSTGKDYAIQASRGQPSMGRIRIVAIREENLLEITLNDAIAEGAFLPKKQRRLTAADFITGFLETWDALHGGTGHDSSHNPRVHVFEFELLGGKPLIYGKGSD